MIDLSSLATFTDAYPTREARLHHDGHQEPLLTVPRLCVLAQTFPRRRITAYQTGSHDIIHNGTPPALLLQGVEGLAARIELTGFDSESAYAELITRTVRPLIPLSAAAGAPIEEVCAAIWIDSPDTAKPAVLLDQHMLVLQCRGAREATVGFPDGTTDNTALDAGAALYVPKGSTLSVRNRHVVSVSLELSWTEAPKFSVVDRLLQSLGAFRRRH